MGDFFEVEPDFIVVNTLPPRACLMGDFFEVEPDFIVVNTLPPRACLTVYAH